MSEKLISVDDVLKYTVLAGEIRNPHMEVIPAYFVRDASAVDAVEVVRCEKCRYRFNSTDGESKEEVMFCNLEFGLAGIINPDDFCSCGERREKNEHDIING